ncbi:MAG: NAD(P)-dependent oxidoreductase [Candidatus Moduliflexus flocculans]|nr:NAD(P)-dependent oxidoreductase [Candidatus Moduliflexus flocculans]
MRSLVTGASGFIGLRLAAELVRRGDEVACLVRPDQPHRAAPRPPGRARPRRPRRSGLAPPRPSPAATASSTLAGVIQARQRCRPSTTANAAGHPPPRRGLPAGGARSRTLRPRLERRRRRVPAARTGRSTEADPPHSGLAYGRGKLAAEEAVRGRRGSACARPSSVRRTSSGPGSKELDGRHPPPAPAALAPSRSATAGRGRSLVDVDDLVAALILAAEHPARPRAETYFVTDGGAYAWPEIVAALAAELGLGRFRFRRALRRPARRRRPGRGLLPAPPGAPPAADPRDRPGRARPVLALRRLEASAATSASGRGTRMRDSVRRAVGGVARGPAPERAAEGRGMTGGRRLARGRARDPAGGLRDARRPRRPDRRGHRLPRTPRPAGLCHRHEPRRHRPLHPLPGRAPPACGRLSLRFVVRTAAVQLTCLQIYQDGRRPSSCVFFPWQDARVLAWERAVFRGQPARRHPEAGIPAR